MVCPKGDPSPPAVMHRISLFRDSLSPQKERFYEQHVFQGHAPVVGSGAEALMPPLAMGQPGSPRGV